MNYAIVQPSLSVDVLWQDSSTSWQATSVGGYADLAKQFLALMGNDPSSPWTLVLDIEGPFRRVEKGAWTAEKLGLFLQVLDRLGVNPALAYHPNAEKSIGDWVDSSLPQTPQNAQLAMIEDLASMNTYIRGLGGGLTGFSVLVGEGNDIPKDEATYRFLRTSLDANGLTDVDLWSTGSFEQGVSVVGNYQPGLDVPDAGTFAQIYDFYNKAGVPPSQANPLVNADTDPADASVLGQQIFGALQFPDNAHMNPELVTFADRAVHTFNFSGADQGSGQTTDAPVFGGNGQSGVVAPGWDLTSFEQVMQGYGEAFSADSRNTAGTSPNLAIWAAENALDVLMPSSDVSSFVTAALTSGGAGPEERVVLNKYEHNVVLVPETEAVTMSVGFSAGYRNGVGLYPLLDETGRMVSLDGDILHPSDEGYLSAAMQLARSLHLWRIDTRAGNDHAHHVVSWTVDVQPGTTYGLIGASNLLGNTELYASLSAANPDGEVHFAGSHDSPGASVGFEDLPGVGDNDFNDVTLTLMNVVQGGGVVGGTVGEDQAVTRFVTESVFDASQFASASLAPDLDSVWMDGTALDKGTAYQLAELIVGNPSNHDLDLVIDVSPPSNQLLNPTPKSHQAAGFPKIHTSFEQYKVFLDNIDLYVSKLSSGQVSWAGDLVYHPQTEVSEFDASVTIDGKVVPTGWAGFEAPVPSDPSKTFTLTSDASKDYEAYIDWMGAFNDYMTVHGQKTFTEFMFEPEGSSWRGRLDALFGPDTARAYAGNPDLFSGDTPPLQSDIAFTVTSSALANWDSQYSRGGWGADGNWAQIYDLMNDPEYRPQWPDAGDTAQLDPSHYLPKDVAQMFIDFLVSPEPHLNPSGQADPRADIYNINRLVTPQANSVSPATEFDPRAHLIFSYGPDQVDGPVFKNADGQHPAWAWGKDDFATMIAALREGLPPALDAVSLGQGQFAKTTDDLHLGVWGSDRALDAWFGMPDPGQLNLIG